MQEIIDKFLDIGCFKYTRGNRNFAELQLIGSEIFVRIENTRHGIEVNWLCLKPLRGSWVQRKADFSDILSAETPDDVAEKIIFNLDIIMELIGESNGS